MREIDLITDSLPRSMRARNLHFAFAREQRHRAHLAQVHANRIVGLVQRTRRQIELGLVRAVPAIDAFAFELVALFRIDQVDAGGRKHREQFFEIFG